MSLAHVLAQVRFTLCSHPRGSSVAQVRVVRPDDKLGGRTFPGHEVDERLERLGHVTVAQVPGAGVTAVHRAVVVLRRRGPTAHSQGRRRKSSSTRRLSLSACSPTSRRRSTRCVDHLVFTGVAEMKPGRAAVSLGASLAVHVEAGIPLARLARPLAGRLCPGKRQRLPSRRADCKGRGRRSRPWGDPADVESLWLRSQPTKSRTSALRHIQVGNRLNPSRASMASASLPRPRT